MPDCLTACRSLLLHPPLPSRNATVSRAHWRADRQTRRRSGLRNSRRLFHSGAFLHKESAVCRESKLSERDQEFSFQGGPGASEWSLAGFHSFHSLLANRATLRNHGKASERASGSCSPHRPKRFFPRRSSSPFWNFLQVLQCLEAHRFIRCRSYYIHTYILTSI